MKNYSGKIIFFVGFLSLLLVSCQKQKPSSEVQAKAKTKSEITDSISNCYRLGPDKRFLLAIADIHQLLSGQEQSNTKANFQDGKWQLSYGVKVVGDIPEFPDYSNLATVLEKWAAELEKQYPLNLMADSLGQDVVNIDREVRSFHAIELAQAANEAGRLWKNGSHNSWLLLQATRALVALTSQQLDKLEIADEIPAKALALLAVTKALTNYHVDREECLLSYTMGYSQHAVDKGASLPTNDVVRLFVNGEDKQLAELAAGESGSLEGKYLYLLRLAGKHAIQPFWEWVGSQLKEDWNSLMVYKAGLELGSFGISRDLPSALPRVVLINIGIEAATMPNAVGVTNKMRSEKFSAAQYRFLTQFVDAALTSETSTLMNSFETSIGVLGKHYPGPFLDAKTYQAFYKGYFFSSFYLEGLFYLDNLSSAPAASSFAKLLGNSDKSIAADIQRWYTDLANSKLGKVELVALVQDLEGLPQLGAPPILRSMEEAEKYFAYGTPEIVIAMRLVSARLDSRPTHIAELWEKVYDNLLDCKRTDELLGSVARRSAPTYPYMTAWYADFVGNDAQVRALFDSPTLDLRSKLGILGLYQWNKALSQEELIQKYKDLVKLYPDDWALSHTFGKYLVTAGKYSEARSVFNAWLNRKVPTDGLEVTLTGTAIARSYYDEKKYSEGWKVIQPGVKSWQSGTMELAYQFLNKLGRFKEAERMARDVLARYPDILRTRVLLASFYWEQGQYSEATAVLKESPQPVRTIDWQLAIAPTFAEVFSTKSEAEVLSAFTTLSSQFKNFDLSALAFSLSQLGKNELAFEMLSRLKGSPGEQINFWIWGYHQLKIFKGKDVAVQWMKKVLPPPMFGFASMIVYEDDEYDLLWDVLVNADTPDDLAFLWLMRAAAATQSGVEKYPHWNDLVEHYRKIDHGYYESIGRFLVGLSTEEETRVLITEPKKLCEVAYYIGLRAEVEGRYEDASDWYRASIETALDMNGEYRWSLDKLQRWKQAGKSLKRLALERSGEKEKAVLN